MSTLETRLAEARKWYGVSRLARAGFDEAANIAREVVAEKDAEIARLEATLGATSLSAAGWQGRATLAETRKVSDALRRRILALIGGGLVTPVDVDILDRIVAIIESLADAETTT